MVFINKYLLYVLLLASILGEAQMAMAADSLTIEVVSSMAVQSSPLPACQPKPVGDCAIPLLEAFALLNSEDWQSSLPGNVRTVRLRLPSQTFRLDKPLFLRWGKVLTHEVSLEITGQRDKTIFSGALMVNNWIPVESNNNPSRLNPRVLSRVFTADISGLALPYNQIPRARGYGIPPHPVLTELFVDDNPQPIAAWPNMGYGLLFVPAGVSPQDRNTFSVVGRQTEVWKDEPDLIAHAFWKYDWAAQAYLVAFKDAKNNRMQLLGNGSPYGIVAGQRVRIENALAEVDSPGEWYVDRSATRIYYYPQSSEKPAHTELSVASTLLEIENSRNVYISGIGFEKTRGDAITVRSSDRVIFDQIDIRNTGNRGLVIADSRASGVRNCLIENTGQGGILMMGGDRSTLTPARDFIENCKIRRFSRLIKTIAPAVEMHGVGHHVAGNTISDGPHTAILFSGNDHVIENNEISNVVTETSDAGAIYVGRDFTSYGNEIRGNLLRNIQPYASDREVKGVYIDDQASGITVRQNIFAYVQQPVFIGGGRDNVIENNIFYHSSPVVHLDARGVEGQMSQTVDPSGPWLTRLEAVPYRSTLFASRFPNLSRIREDDFGYPKYNVFRKNILIESNGPRVSERARKGIAIDSNIVLDDSAFVVKKDAALRRERSDFVLRGIKPN